ncbi:hypothetical protein EHQ43_06490 [Leptospira bouyouniensis]|uniref:Uncharacterized protein n=1 Tax=Leptospira bouyouniensis TaxID=2484911 RepID=A0A7I0HSX5_9LEPT|nr:hypothetical protein [Leptospira bouyouniensis]TGL07069.1 hypothetical protein EHQ43_06490 [Leptospira bouyouniensis]
MNWKFKIRKPQQGTTLTWELYFPPGTSTWVGDKVKENLDQIPLPNQPEANVRTFSEKIKIENTNAHQITYLLFNGYFIRDLRLVIARTNDWDKSAEKREEEWDRILTEAVSIAKPLFSNPDTKFYEIKENLHISFFEDEITVSLSVLGEPGYKRGIKATFPTSAPVPEDLAHILIEECFQIFSIPREKVNSVYIPFAGTMTFATEWKLGEEKIPFLSLPREFIWKKLTLFPEKSYEHFLKKRNTLLPNNTHVTPMVIQDTDPALTPYWTQEFSNWRKWIHVESIDHTISDFLKTFPVFSEGNENTTHYFIPLNPPYGYRKNEMTGPEEKLYAKIGNRLNVLSKDLQKKFSIIGFILCPNEDKWSDCMKELKNFSKKTIHVTHGGIDLRVLFFHLEGKSERSSN